jgi:hypothetical protein
MIPDSGHLGLYLYSHSSNIGIEGAGDVAGYPVYPYPCRGCPILLPFFAQGRVKNRLANRHAKLLPSLNYSARSPSGEPVSYILPFLFFHSAAQTIPHATGIALIAQWLSFRFHTNGKPPASETLYG